MVRFNWNSKKDVEKLMSEYRLKFSRWSEVRILTEEEIDLWASLDYYFVCKDGFYRVKQLLYNYLID